MPTTVNIKKLLEGSSECIADLLVTKSGDEEQVIGQAWIAGQDLLIACGHVVEPYAGKLGTLIARFPATNRRYSVLNIRMHPNYQKDVAYFGTDMAALTVELSYPERDVAPLPVRYLEARDASAEVTSMRFNIVDERTLETESVLVKGELTGVVDKKRGLFNHNLSLPISSIGCPIFLEGAVVAINCGSQYGAQSGNDSKLALAANAVKEFNLTEVAEDEPEIKLFNGVQVFFSFLLGLTFLVVAICFLHVKARDAEEQNRLTPLTVIYNKPMPAYTENEPLTIDLAPRNACYLLAVYTEKQEGYPIRVLVYPADPDAEPVLVEPNHPVRFPASLGLRAGAANLGRLHIFASKDAVKPLRSSELDSTSGVPLFTHGASLDTIRNRYSYYMSTKGLPADDWSEVVMDTPTPTLPTQ